MIYLTKVEIKNEKNVNIHFEKVTKNLLLVEINFERDDCSTRVFYWMLTKVGAIPPLEIGVDLGSDEIVNLSFFIDFFHEKNLDEKKIKETKGSLKVETKFFDKSDRYIENNEGYSFILDGNMLTCVFDFNDGFNQSYVNKNFKMYTNNKESVVGFSIKLSEEEMLLVKSIKYSEDNTLQQLMYKTNQLILG